MRAELVTLTASVLINAGVLFSVDHAALRLDQTLQAHHRSEAARLAARRAEESMDFEFVEAPPVAQKRRPRPSRKISSRDSVAQDMTKDKSAAQEAPHASALGLTDQLRQERGKPASMPSTAAPEVTPRPAQMQPQEQEVPKEPSAQPTDALKQATPALEPPRPASAPSPERPAVQGLGGPDRISTLESSRARSRGAEVYGVTSFEATGSGMGEYMKNLKEKIWLAWFPYLMTNYPKDFKTADALIGFTIDAQGNVSHVRVLDSKGSVLFSAFCMAAVQRGGPFGPLPKEILALTGKDEIDIKFAFHYW